MARQIAVSLARPGMRLARALYDERGRILLQAGVILTEYHVRRLQQAFAVITIDDQISAGIAIPEVIDAQLRMEVQRTLGEEWSRLKTQASFKRVSFTPTFSKEMRKHARRLLDIMQCTEIIQEDMASLAGYDNSTYVHSVNVAIYSLMLGVGLGLSESMLMDLGLGALLHDIGKMWIPITVLNKPGGLTAEEYNLMKNHAELGHRVLTQQHELSFLVAHCAYQHHERINGSGYPRGLRGDEIHLFGRIVAVADVYDAMVMHRPYREGVSPGDVIEYLFSRADVEYDFSLVELFGKRVVPFPVGTEIQLSDGTVGIVARLHTDTPARPVVRVIRDCRGRDIDPIEVDLRQRLNVTVVRSGSVSLFEQID